MVSALISRVVVLGVGTLYPAYRSYKAVRTKNVREYVKWMMYWIVFALYLCVETIADLFASFWVPFYYELKIIFVFWLITPYTKGYSRPGPMLQRRERVRNFSSGLSKVVPLHHPDQATARFSDVESSNGHSTFLGDLNTEYGTANFIVTDTTFLSASVLYRKFIHPALQAHEDEIDEYLDRAKSTSYSTLVNFGSKGVKYAREVATNAVLTSQMSLVNQLKKSYSMSDINANDEQRANEAYQGRSGGPQIDEIMEVEEDDEDEQPNRRNQARLSTTALTVRPRRPINSGGRSNRKRDIVGTGSDGLDTMKMDSLLNVKRHPTTMKTMTSTMNSKNLEATATAGQTGGKPVVLASEDQPAVNDSQRSIRKKNTQRSRDEASGPILHHQLGPKDVE